MSQLGLGMTRDEGVDPSGQRPRRRRVYPAVILALIVVGALIFAAGFYSIRWITGGNDDYTGQGSGRVVVQVHQGEALRSIGQAMADAGVVKSSDAFTSAAALEPRSKSIAPGAYAMRLGMSGSAAVAWMLDPASRDVAKVVIPEGLRMSQVVSVIAKATGLSEDDIDASLAHASELGLPADAGGSPEGYLFPATYEFPRDVSADTVVRTMIARTAQAFVDLDVVAAAKELNLTPDQVLIVASLVQGESAMDDYPKVARVIYNRLAKGSKLQLDSTVNYGLGTNDLHLSQSQLASNTPYNTYVIKGLPPTPIGAPGERALDAALNPAKGSWLYFISTDPAAGITKFTSSYQQFVQWKQQYQAANG